MRELVDLNRVSPERCEQVLADICALDTQVFRYPNDATQARYYAGTRAAAERRIAILYHEEGRLVGYNLVKLHEHQEGGRSWSVVTSNAGFLPEHVGSNRTLPDAFRLMVSWMVREPWRRWYFASFIVSPAAYDLLVGVNPSLAPSPIQGNLSDEAQTVLRATAQRAGIRINTDEPGHLTVRLRRPRAEFTPRRITRAMTWYQEHCPDFANGEALGVFAPITARAVVQGLYRQWQRKRARAATRTPEARPTAPEATGIRTTAPGAAGIRTTAPRPTGIRTTAPRTAFADGV